MSDSDDTDVLLLIPPDLFLVPSSSESDICSDQVKERYNNKKTGVISELVEHMQSLESRISAIESKNTSLDITLLNNSLESEIHSDSVGKFRQTLPKTKFSVSENCSLQNTPVKPGRSLSVPSTPNSRSLPNCINNSHQNDMNLGNRLSVSISTNATNANEHDEYKHDSLTSQSCVVVSSTACNVGCPHVTVTSPEGKFHSHPINCRNTNNICVKLPSNKLHSMPSTSTLLSTTEQPQSHSKTSIPEMELSEVDELLQEMEATELELSKRINRASMHHCIKEQNDILSNESNGGLKSKDYDAQRQSVIRKLEFKPYDSSDSHNILSLNSNKKSDVFADISLPYNDSFHTNETDKIISEFKTWGQNTQYQVSKTEEVESTESVNSNNIESVVKTTDVQKEEPINQQVPLNVDNVNSINNLHNTQANNIHKKLDTSSHNELVQCNTATKSTECNSLYLPESYKSMQQNGNVLYKNQAHDVPFVKNIAHASTNTEFLPRYFYYK